MSADASPRDLESEAYAIAFWIATEARVKEHLGLSVQPVEAEGSRRILKLLETAPLVVTAGHISERTP